MSAKHLIGASLAALILISGAPAWAQDQGSQKFIQEAIQGNMAEVQMGQLAQKQGTSEGVRSFGQMLQTDHTDALGKAKTVASSVGLKNPPTSVNAKQKADYDRLAKLSGATFDTEFAKHMVMDHQKDIMEYQAEAKKSDAAATYARETLPTLQKHLQTAQSISGSTTTGQGAHH